MEECIKCQKMQAEMVKEVYGEESKKYDSLSYTEFKCKSCGTVFRQCVGIIHFSHIVETEITAGDILGIGTAYLDGGDCLE